MLDAASNVAIARGNVKNFETWNKAKLFLSAQNSLAPKEQLKKQYRAEFRAAVLIFTQQNPNASDAQIKAEVQKQLELFITKMSAI
eukprot:m.215163 g.215163  ORF g.215163 m.215163 type:complete len:86 (+) comp26203_c0_seq22:4350-4607(+)